MSYIKRIAAGIGHKTRVLAVVGVAGVSLSAATPADAGSPYLIIPPEEQAMLSPAYRYANMTDDQAYAELDRRGVLYQRVGEVDGVRAPIRLTGKLRGVHIHSALPPEKRPDSVFEILDARLALSLDDFAVILAKHDIVEVIHYTMYRPGVGGGGGGGGGGVEHQHDHDVDRELTTGKHAPAKSKLGGVDKSHDHATGQKQKPAKRRVGKVRVEEEKPSKPAPKAEQKPAAKPAPSAAPAKPASKPQSSATKPARKPAPPGTRHPAGLAIDVGALKKSDGTWLSVANHFDGNIGEQTCGAGARVPNRKEAVELRAIVCDALEAGVFTYALTPNFDAPHQDHFHMEIKPGVKWFLFH